MKYLIAIPAMFFSGFLYAQTNIQPAAVYPATTVPASVPVNTAPAIPITSATSTTIITQPASMPGSNTNPVTGTVISLKTNKKAADASAAAAPPVNNTGTVPVNKGVRHTKKHVAKKKVKRS